MTHLPECELKTCELMHPEMLTTGKFPRCTECGESCICDELRACEQRVMQDAKEWEADAYIIGFTVGKNKALDAAREALTEALNGLPIKWTSDELFPAVLTIHRVFDSLKEKQ